MQSIRALGSRRGGNRWGFGRRDQGREKILWDGSEENVGIPVQLLELNVVRDSITSQNDHSLYT